MLRMNFDFSGLILLRQSPIAYFIILLLALFECISYAMASLIMVPYLTDLGFSDALSAWLYSLYGIIVSVVGIACGFMIDSIGIKNSLLCGALFLSIARLGMALVHNAFVFVFLLLFILPFGSAMFFPSVLAGVRKHTTLKTRSFGFSCFYVILALSSLLAGFLVDAVRMQVKPQNFCPATTNFLPIQYLDALNGSTVFSTSPNFLRNDLRIQFQNQMPKESINLVGDSKELLHDPYRLILFLIAISSILLLPIICFCFNDVESTDRVENIVKHPNGTLDSVYLLVTTSSFQKLFFLVTLSTAIFQVHRHLEITLPKYLMRVVGCDVSFGSIFSFNSILVIILIPFATALTANFHMVTCILIGAIFISLSPFVFAFSSSVFIAIVHVSILSVGQAFLNPRINEYSIAVAPEGQEGTYLALSHAPTFLAKIFSGMSGNLFEFFCPCHLSACEPCCLTPRIIGSTHLACPSGHLIWVVIGSISCAATLAIFFFLPWFRESEKTLSCNAVLTVEDSLIIDDDLEEFELDSERQSLMIRGS